MRFAKTAALFSGLLAIGLAETAIGAASAAPHHSAPIIGHVYVDDNTAGTNTIAAFDRHSTGLLTPHPGGPIDIGGAGSGTGLGAQGALALTPNGRFVLAVDPGSSQISVLRVEASGGLRPAAGGPVSSNGNEPVSIAITPWGHKDLVYVANAGDGDANYTGFTLGRGGALQPLTHSTISVPDGSALGDVLFNRYGTRLAGTRVGTSLNDSFNVGRNGLLYPAVGSPFAAQGPGPIGAEFSPTRPNQLFVSNAHGGANNGTVSAYDVSNDGVLHSIGAGPFADNQTAPCWVEISHNGKFLFTSNTAVPSISSYSIASNGALTLLGSQPLDATTEKGPVDLRLSPNGQRLYVVDGGSASISTFNVHGGALTELTTSPTPLPTGATGAGIVVT